MLIHPDDNVEVRENGHKYALVPLKKGDRVIKYGYPIGEVTVDVAKGEHVHTHNLKTLLGEKLEYAYCPRLTPVESLEAPTVSAYLRPDGRVGIRNDVWILCTVGCINKSAEAIARKTGAKFFPHPYGCSQLGGDHERTRLILKGLALHPNAGGVLVLGLGCENNTVESFKALLGDFDRERIRFLVAQEVEDEIGEGVAIVKELQKKAACDEKVPVPFSRLSVGLKCGGSDAFSGITANPLVGAFCDRFTAMGGSCVMTEVPEMFGAEHLLMERCVSREVFDKTVDLVNGFKDYYLKNEMPVYENPSPGNKEGGITTLEEKSLGCTQKGGFAPVVDVLGYGDRVTKAGLSLLEGPGNDMVAITNLFAAGCHLILFTTGRGTPLGTGVPTLKIASGTALSEKKKSWIDLDAEKADVDELFDLILDTAEGKKCRNEENGYEEIAIFKDGVTL